MEDEIAVTSTNTGGVLCDNFQDGSAGPHAATNCSSFTALVAMQSLLQMSDLCIVWQVQTAQLHANTIHVFSCLKSTRGNQRGHGKRILFAKWNCFSCFQIRMSATMMTSCLQNVENDVTIMSESCDNWCHLFGCSSSLSGT